MTFFTLFLLFIVQSTISSQCTYLRLANMSVSDETISNTYLSDRNFHSLTSSRNFSKNSRYLANDDQKCSLYSERKFLPKENTLQTPILYTFPGSGNTWARTLIEFGTGYYSGSFYHDADLKKMFPGEGSCDISNIVVKAHPHHYGGYIFEKPMRKKCDRQEPFQRAIMLIRSPYDCIWAEYQRRWSGSHAGGITKKEFDEDHWLNHVRDLSHMFVGMWTNKYSEVRKKLKPEKYIFIRYEDLVDQSTRIATLTKVVQFLKQTPLPNQVECAFILADKKHAIHRSIEDNMVTKEMAYNKDLVCKMWRLFSEYISSFNYGPFGGFKCDSKGPVLK